MSASLTSLGGMVKKSLTVALGVVVVGTLALSGCASNSGERAVPANRPAPVSIAAAPLTGELVGADVIAHPSIAVKIDNHELARPQWELNRTDIVFEELVEGGLTRYVAVWHSDIPVEVGPVRSIRPMDPDIMTSFGGIAVYSGGQQQFVDMIQASGLQNYAFDYDTTGLFYRSKENVAPHNVIFRSEEAVSRHTDLAAPQAHFTFGSAAAFAALGGDPVNKLLVRFSNARFPTWDWDAASGSWLRSQEGTVPDTQRGGDRITAKNVVIMRVNIDESYGAVPKTVMVGSGEAFVASAGSVVKAVWSKESASAPIVVTDENGKVIPLTVGNTWIELVPASGSVSFE